MILYNYFMPVQATVKTITQGAVNDLIHYYWRPQGRGLQWIGSFTALRVIEMIFTYTRHEIDVLLPNQCKSTFTLCQEALHLRFMSPSV